MTNPNIGIGNIVIGDRYIEPYGESTIRNLTTGDICLINIKKRGKLTTKEKNYQYAEATIKNKNNEPKYTL